MSSDDAPFFCAVITRSSCLRLSKLCPARWYQTCGIALCSLVDDKTGLPFGTGDVDGHVEVTKAGYGLVDQPSDFVIVTDIGLDEDGLRAEPAAVRLGGPYPRPDGDR